ncbi:TonB-dependent receptor [Sphingomonas sp. BIUV-7]|uniref:TonB-dependent receptor n=1 Tax=Sphingomonas natans TaxID=3063330 RepID=A0ABT8Y6T7_9SPHN|nr:TonB-dependent receptor [Sphingomonas sp. BIUV-7]MDO6414039.1 TonB-dependent receptor [Sphingomonas sp. BIUV-7]
MKVITYLGTASILALSAVPAAAQQAPVSDPNYTADIVVTANRTQSLLSKTPVAISAITGEGLRAAGITNPTALADQVPNISIDRNNGGLQITIRGVTSTDLSEKGDPSAAFLLDGVYIARAQAQEVSFFDVGRVEVLRGPQGTLYGRNTTAGLVNVITNRPAFDLGGSADISVGNYDAYQGSAVLNIPASDRLAFRASVNFDQRDNYLRFGPNFTSDADPFRKNLSGRIQGLFTWDTGEVLIRADYSDIKGNVYDLLPLYNFFAPTATGVDPVYRNRTAREYLTQNSSVAWDLFRRNHTAGIGGELTQEVGPVSLTYVGSYRELKRNEGDARISADSLNSFRNSFDGTYKQYSHELRAATNGTGPLKFQAGGYYFKEDSDIILKLLSGRPNPGANGDGPTLAFSQVPTKAESYAFFGQATYSITSTLRATGGARYSHDDKSRVGYTVNCASFFTCAVPPGAVPNNNAERTFSKTTWRAGLDFDVNASTLVYGTVSTGYKAGGFNDGCQIGTATGCVFDADTLYYNPETLMAYEAGIKAGLLDNAVRLNVSAFHYDYSNIQLTQIRNDCGGGLTCQVTLNGGKAKISGVEIEGVLKPSRNDKVDFGVNYLDAHYSQFALPPFNFAGRSLDRAPRWTVMAGYQHTIPLGSAGEIVGGIRTRLSDNYVLLSIGTRNFYTQPSFTKTDATLTYNAPGKRWYIQGFVKNIENTISIATIAVGTRSSVQVAEPRTYGLRAGVTF